MLYRLLPGQLIGALTLLLYTINTIFWFGPILIIAFIKLILPIKAITAFCNYLLNFFASSWISINTLVNKLTKPITWEVTLPENLSTKEWYLVVANHKSWVDILALQQTLNGKIPFLKFFLKQELFWIPVLGIAWWALDFPFMKRYSKSYLKKNPHKKGKDFDTTKEACEKFKSIPISIMNFAEGTRFTAEKQARQKSPYQHLLKPKSGGIGYVLTLMGDEITKVLNITIDYPDNQQAFSFWDYLCGRVRRIKLHAELIDTPQSIKGDYINDPNNRRETQQWVNRLWQEKDERLSNNEQNNS
ncbi:acyltransferase [Aliikangiella sp. IMCC44359]|uniref:acyltransferase n=1 Tax=Aliikangiella sp. IMCC44359 TaxID=3459125 RepID=UPI00403B0D4B